MERNFKIMALYTDFTTPSGTVTDAAAINNAIKNILLTKIGSLPGKPTFGCNLDNVLFSQLDQVTMSVARKQVQISLIRWEKRIQVTDIIITPVHEFNKLVIVIHYMYKDKGLNLNQQISISLTQ